MSSSSESQRPTSPPAASPPSPLISVLMPAYNVGPYIGAAIASVLAQTHANLELLIQDDGSRDNTREIAASFAASDKRVRLLPDFPENRGVVAARNALLAAASGEFMAWMDSDDVSLPERLERQLAFLRANPSVAAVGTALALADQELYVYDAQFFPKDVERQRNDPYIACQTIMARAEIVMKAGGFRELFRVGGEDGDWLLRIADHADVTTLDDILYVYRMRGGLSQANAAPIRRLGVIARAAAAVRRLGKADPLDSIVGDGALAAVSDASIIQAPGIPVKDKIDVLAVPLHDAEPLASVIVPVRQGVWTERNAAALRRCCEWLGRQNFRNAEIVFCHPSGWSLSEDSLQLLRGLPARFLEAQCEPLTHKFLSALLHVGRGMIFVWQEPSDYPREMRLHYLVEEMIKNPDEMAIGTAINIVDEGIFLRSDTYSPRPFNDGVFSGCAASFALRRTALFEYLQRSNERRDSRGIHLEDILRELNEYGSIRNAPEIAYFAQLASGAAVSVLIDMSQVDQTLEQCLASLDAQTMRNFEVVACLDPALSQKDRIAAKSLISQRACKFHELNSEIQDSDQLVNNYRLDRLFSKTKYSLIDVRPGGSVTDRLNALLDNCEGRLVVFHPTSHCSAPRRLEKLLAYMAANPDCNAVGSAVACGGGEHVFPRQAMGKDSFNGFPESFMIRRRSAILAGRLRRSLPLSFALQDFLERITPPESVHNIEDVLYTHTAKSLRRSLLEPSGSPPLRRAASMALFLAKNRRRSVFGPRARQAEPVPAAASSPASAEPEKPLLDVVLRETGRAPTAPAEPPELIARCYDNWYDFDDAIRYLTPGGSGVFEGVAFVRDDMRAPDWQVVFNHPGSSAVRFEARPERVLFAIGEPPTKPFRHLQLGQGRGTTVMTSDEELAASRNPARRFVLTPCMTRTWSMNRPYDELMRTVVAEKPGRLSWVTSNLAMVAGHHKRLEFLEALRARLPFDLYGRGFRAIPDKWQALAPYRYSIAFENSRKRYYFTEKIMDCFVAETMPIYFGCPNILDFFPAEALVIIDPQDPDVFARIDEVINSDLHLRNRDAILEAKRLVVERYNLFARIARFIRSQPPATSSPVPMVIHPIHLDFSDDGETTPHVDLALTAGRP